ncbi:MAG: LptA/OstA family protein [candidate division WOR-3 bacterium]
MNLILVLLITKFSYEADSIKIIPKMGMDLIVAKGNINLSDGKTLITGDSALIFKSSDVDSGFIYGNVNIKGEEIEISCKRAKYNFLKEEAGFFENVKVKGKEEVIFAENIKYFSKEKFAVAKGNILIEKGEIKIFCDEANYDFKRKKGIINFIEKIQIISENKIINLYGKKIEVVPDTLYLVGNVKIETEKENAEGDTLIYLEKEEVAYLKGNPVLYFEKGNARGEGIELKFKDKKIEKGKILKNSSLEILTEKEEKVIINTYIIESFFDEDGNIKNLIGFDKVEGIIFLNKIKNGR